ncbi:MAG: hypothetical protein EON60_02420 [Alphaproteobacteria bacterium]|nr:MAG: hypothetical protein EON60_02420 [Alphaproteobacteria bacterium]
MLMNRRSLLSRSLTAGVALAVAPALHHVAFAADVQPIPEYSTGAATPVHWTGYGPQPLHDVLNGNVAAADVHQICMDRQDYFAVVDDIRAYRNNGMVDEYQRRLDLLKTIAVDWLPEGDNRHGWMRASADEVANLPRNRARFVYDYEGSLALGTA